MKYELDQELFKRLYDFIEAIEDGADPISDKFWAEHKVTDEEKPMFLNALSQTCRQTRRNNSEIIESCAYKEVEEDEKP